MKHTIKTIPNRLCGAVSHDVDSHTIHIWEADRDRTPLYVIGHQFGPVCAVFARSEQDALDIAADADLLVCFAVDPDVVISADDNGELHDDCNRTVTGLGNASDSYLLEDCWIQLAETLFQQSAQFAYAVGLANGAANEVLS